MGQHESTAAPAHRSAFGRWQSRQAAPTRSDGLGIFGRHGQAGLRFGHRVVAGFDRMQHRDLRHHVVHQLVRSDAEAVDRRALPTDISDVKACQQGRNLQLGDGRKQRHIADRFGAQPLGQPGFFMAAADQQDRHRFVLEQLGRVEQKIERIGQPMRARIAEHHSPCSPLRFDEFRQTGIQRLAFALPFIECNAVGHDRELAQVQAMLLHMLVHLGQHRDDEVGITVAIVFGFLALVCLGPLFLLVAILIKVEDGGAIFLAQTRVGRHGREFKMYKFRSMVVNAEAKLKELLAQNQHTSGVTFKIKDDPRITKVGKWLRKFSIDEFPQFYNVLRGDMSIVGPRPCLPREVELYTLEQRRRLEVMPGLTCLWQIGGRAEIDFSGQVQLDVRYIESQSFLGDLKILAKTVPAVLLSKGAY